MGLRTVVNGPDGKYGLTEVICDECGVQAALGKEVKHQTECPSYQGQQALCTREGCVYKEPHPPHRARAYKGERECEATGVDYLIYNGMA
jgi:hypothetical protein